MVTALSDAVDWVFNNTTRVVLLGVTGAGKSELGNTLAGEKVFVASASAESCTSRVLQRNVRWFAKSSEKKIFLVDTCGLGDSQGRDELQFEELLHTLRRLGYVNGFLLVLNSQSDRLDDQIKKMFKRFKEAFGLEVFQHMMIVFTRWPYDKKDILKRKKNQNNGELSLEDQKRNGVNECLKNDIGCKQSVPCVFLDCLNALETDTDLVADDEKQLHWTQLKEIRDFCMKQNQFKCMELQKYLYLKKNLDAANSEHREFFERIMKQQKELLDLGKKNSGLESQLIDLESKDCRMKFDLVRSLDQHLNGYFDEIKDTSIKPSLLNDVWEICIEFNKTDSKRISKGGFLSALEDNLNKKLSEIIEKRLLSFLKDEAKKLADSCEKDLKNIVKDLPITTDVDLNFLKAVVGLASITAAAFGSAGVIALAEMGLLAAVAGVVGLLILAVGGVVMLKNFFEWDRAEEIKKFTYNVTDRMRSNSMKAKLKEVCMAALDRIMHTIIYHRNEELIKNYSR